ncbi:MAG TPA: hypothetical protein H9856_05860 [Candidatus Limosilactobacillus merdigallinarum]|uniref:Uncharacterized protein n=1 Tax=Candidatus Limosilactobacillus merdigallinarum TaxID=2838652 RepID=A0A9D1VIA6_9LACO|nr:hypothetical protein [Candidatus Limosilactobacillus merdigallinarum]
MTFYNTDQADQVATEFFDYYYHDRGKVKWDGYFLSEHQAALKKHKADATKGLVNEDF